LRSGYRRRLRRNQTKPPGINSDSGLEMQTKSLLSKGSRKPNACDLVVRHLPPTSGIAYPKAPHDWFSRAVPPGDEAPPDTSIFPADSGLRFCGCGRLPPSPPARFPFPPPPPPPPRSGGRSTRAAVRPSPHKGTRRGPLRETATARKATFSSAPDRALVLRSLAKRKKTWQGY
jgi:hypothetical protein